MPWAACSASAVLPKLPRAASTAAVAARWATFRPCRWIPAWMMPRVRSMIRLNRTAHCVLSLRPRSSRARAHMSDLGELGLDESSDQSDDDRRDGHCTGDDDRRFGGLAQAALVAGLG